MPDLIAPEGFRWVCVGEDLAANDFERNAWGQWEGVYSYYKVTRTHRCMVPYTYLRAFLGVYQHPAFVAGSHRAARLAPLWA
jgi:hypothetical protein